MRGSGSLSSRVFVLLPLLFFSAQVWGKECNGDECRNRTLPPLKFEDIVPENYDKLVPPGGDGKVAEVLIKIAIINIQSVDEAKQVFTADLFLHQTWTDARVKIPKSHSTNRLVLDRKWRHNLWTPDTYFKNSVDGKVNDIIIPYNYMVIDNSSTIFFAARISLKLNCEMNLGAYPHDVQECDIFLMSLQHTTDTVVLQWKEFEITKNIFLAQYNVIGSSQENSTKHYKIGNFSYLLGRITLARRLGFFLINKYIPCVLIVFMSFVTFWVPSEAYPARVTLSVTSLLTIVTQQYQTSMPSVSYVVALNIWMLSCIGFVFFSLLEYAFVISVMNDKGTNLWPFCRIKNFFTNSKASNSTDNEVGKALNHAVSEPVSKVSHQAIDRMSRLIFPLFFMIFCICYFSYYCR